ncbi:MAG: DUF456 domain-containing protein [Candidatus Taylorbacteria bacterium]|nr:DUF456 domain-containing protein [Candidatus Taylorbacteria bacterium]
MKGRTASGAVSEPVGVLLPMSHITLTILFSLLLLPAVFLALIPMMPAMSYMFAVALLYGLIDGFGHLAFSEFTVLAVIFCLSLLVDYSAGILGAKYAGASKQSIIWGFVGLIIGSVLFPPFGGIPGLFIAVFLAEILLNKNKVAAWKAATGSLLGAITGLALNLFLALAFFVLFIVFSV